MQEKSFETAQDVKKKLESYRYVCAFCGSADLEVEPTKRHITTSSGCESPVALLIGCRNCGKDRNGNYRHSSYYCLKEKGFGKGLSCPGRQAN